MNQFQYTMLAAIENEKIYQVDQIRTQRFYPLRVGTNPNHFTVRCPCALSGTAFVAPQLIPAAAATETTGA
jgi:hypothetical protein